MHGAQSFLPALAVVLCVAAMTTVLFWRSAANLEDVRTLMPVSGEPLPMRLEARSPAVGRTLSELNLRGMTGATVPALRREAGPQLLAPTAHDVLQAGDVLALAGTHESIQAARTLLGPGA